MNIEIEIKKMPSINVAYITHVGSFEGIGKAYKKLLKWAYNNKVSYEKTITVYHDNPNITDISKLRQSACITLKQSVQTRGEINLTTIKEGNYAVGKFEVSFLEFKKAWQSMMIWIRKNEYKINNKRGSYEIYHNNFKNHPENKSIIEICIPVE